MQLLERENARLLEENRRLLNIIAPRLGYEPLDQPEKKPAGKPKARKLSIQQWAVSQMRKANLIPTVFADLPRPERKKEHNGDADKPAADA